MQLPTTQVWVLRSQSLTWPSANAAKKRGTSPNLEPLYEIGLAMKIKQKCVGAKKIKI
ncbi:MAG: hypothetical protein JXC36_09480 [Candidatus Atribacteria bacterium]|nr:hypothetical protein [Candidatus Atribacteria bacterium]